MVLTFVFFFLNYSSSYMGIYINFDIYRHWILSIISVTQIYRDVSTYKATVFHLIASVILTRCSTFYQTKNNKHQPVSKHFWASIYQFTVIRNQVLRSWFDSIKEKVVLVGGGTRLFVLSSFLLYKVTEVRDSLSI